MLRHFTDGYVMETQTAPKAKTRDTVNKKIKLFLPVTKESLPVKIGNASNQIGTVTVIKWVIDK